MIRAAFSREDWIVFDLGFGDAGKGATVDFLVREREISLVVRFHGGAQAGHNVVTPEGKHHIFSQFASGTFVPGVCTLLGPDFLLHPGGMLVEEKHLQSVGIQDVFERTFVDERAIVVTPFHQAAGRLRELHRGPEAHGTCGLGVGEAMEDRLQERDDTIRAADLFRPDQLASKLEQQRQRKHRKWSGLGQREDLRVQSELDLLSDTHSVERTLQLWDLLRDRLQVCTAEETKGRIQERGAVVFEGAQGILLDQDHGFHPHTTWSDCTPGGALALLEEINVRPVRLGVLRTYMVRHGIGPMPTHDPAWDGALPELHNGDQGWQGPVRRGPLDLPLLRYAVRVAGGIDGLAVNGMDRIGEEVKVCVDRTSLSGKPWEGTSRFESVKRHELGSFLEKELRKPVLIESWGPSASDRKWRSLPKKGIME